jgi:hypothetical protein
VSGLLFPSVQQPNLRREWRQETPREYTWSSADPDGMRPWCRRCKRRVDDWLYDRYEGDFWGFVVRCHGETMGGLIPYLAPFYGCVLEAFCDDEPRSREGRWFFIGCDGVRMQESPAYVAATVVKGAFSSSGFGGWARRNQADIGLLVMLLFMLSGMLWRMR